MIEKEIAEFTKYANTFDMNVDAIKLKYFHTLRVVEYTRKILNIGNYAQDLIRLSLIGALLHDIARFKQWTDYNTYKDCNSFDHGNMAYEILKHNNYINNYVNNDSEKDIILNAVKQHNKKELELNGNLWADFVAKVVRDADKIDILEKQYNLNDTNLYLYKDYLNEFGSLSDSQFDINDILLDDIVHKRLCSNSNVKYYFDAVLRELAFIFDLNFKESFQIIKDLKIVESKMKLLRYYNKKDENIEKINIIEKTLIDFIDNKLKED